jgi:hypothetical protein
MVFPKLTPAGIEPWHGRDRQILAGDLSVQHRYATPPSDHIPLGGVVRCTLGRQQDRDAVKLFHSRQNDETIHGSDEAIFLAPRSHPATNGWYQRPWIKQRGSIMWAIIIRLIYRQACRKYLAAMRKQRALDHLWA